MALLLEEELGLGGRETAQGRVIAEGADRFGVGEGVGRVGVVVQPEEHVGVGVTGGDVYGSRSDHGVRLHAIERGVSDGDDNGLGVLEDGVVGNGRRSVGKLKAGSVSGNDHDGALDRSHSVV